MKKIIILCLLSLVSSQTFAGLKLEKCDDPNINVGISSLVPGMDNQRSIYNKAVTLYRYDQSEPAAVPEGIAISFISAESAREGLAFPTCLAIPYLNSVDLKNATSTYNARSGVRLLVPVKNYDVESGRSVPAKIEILIRAVKTESDLTGYEVSASKL